jgi:hypothetical protein
VHQAAPPSLRGGRRSPPYRSCPSALSIGCERRRTAVLLWRDAGPHCPPGALSSCRAGDGVDARPCPRRRGHSVPAPLDVSSCPFVSTLPADQDARSWPDAPCSRASESGQSIQGDTCRARLAHGTRSTPGDCLGRLGVRWLAPLALPAPILYGPRRESPPRGPKRDRYSREGGEPRLHARAGRLLTKITGVPYGVRHLRLKIRGAPLEPFSCPHRRGHSVVRQCQWRIVAARFAQDRYTGVQSPPCRRSLAWRSGSPSMPS